MIEFEVPGNPKGKGRPHAFAFHGHAKFCPDKKTVSYETQVKERFASCFPGFTPMTGPVNLYVEAYFMVPVSKSKKVQEAMLGGFMVPTKPPDIFNILCVVADALNGIAYLDDKQVVSTIGAKYYSDRPRVKVVIYPWPATS